MRRLLIRPGGIGDFIVSLPALESLRSGYTEVWCSSPNLALARFADSARSISAAGLDRFGILNDEDVVQRLRAFDEIISWYGANRPEFRDRTSLLGLPFHFCAALPGVGEHAVECYNAQARELGGRPVRVPHLQVPMAERRYAVINPLASSHRKQAPLSYFQALACRLERQMPVHWLNGPDQLPDLYELACWLAGARVYIGNDSGISHLAAAVNTPVLSLFSAGDTAVWSPRGFGWAVSIWNEKVSLATGLSR